MIYCRGLLFYLLFVIIKYHGEEFCPSTDLTGVANEKGRETQLENLDELEKLKFSGKLGIREKQKLEKKRKEKKQTKDKRDSEFCLGQRSYVHILLSLAEGFLHGDNCTVIWNSHNSYR